LKSQTFLDDFLRNYRTTSFIKRTAEAVGHSHPELPVHIHVTLMQFNLRQ